MTSIAGAAPDPAIGAAVDLGSTSVHLLVASVEDGRIAPLDDESAFLGLGAAAAGRGSLGADGRRILATTLAGFAERARALGAARLVVVGTEPLRRLADADRIVAEASAAAAAPVHVLSHEEEGFLTLLGVREGRRVERELLVIDIGGGSSEFVVAAPGRPAAAVGVRVGAGSLTADCVAHDPPTAEEHLALRSAAAAALARAPGGFPAEIALVGGTASNLLKLVPERRADGTLTEADLLEARWALSSGPAESVGAARGIRPARVRLLAAGAAIVEAVMRRYEVDRVRVVDAGIREGAVLAIGHGGPAWRDRLPALTAGWLD